MTLEELEELFLARGAEVTSAREAWNVFSELLDVRADGIPPDAESVSFGAVGPSGTSDGTLVWWARELAVDDEDGEWLETHVLAVTVALPIRLAADEEGLLVSGRPSEFGAGHPLPEWRRLVERSRAFVAAMDVAEGENIEFSIETG